MQAFRRQRLAAAMAEQGLQTLVASTPENVFYATGHWSVANSILRSAVALAVLAGRGAVAARIQP